MVATNYAWNPVFDCITKETDDAGATVAEYTQEPRLYGGLISQHRGSTSNYYHYDQIGSMRVLTAANQTTSDTAVYTAFGERVAFTGTTANDFQFGGYFGYLSAPSTGTPNCRMRNLSVRTANWMSRDPIIQLNWEIELVMHAFTQAYQYVSNTPSRKTDPSGLTEYAECLNRATFYCAAKAEHPENKWLDCACTVANIICQAAASSSLLKGEITRWYYCMNKCMFKKWLSGYNTIYPDSELPGKYFKKGKVPNSPLNYSGFHTTSL